MSVCFCLRCYLYLCGWFLCAERADWLVVIMAREVSVCLTVSVPGCTCMALNGIKKEKNTWYYYGAIYMSFCAWVYVCVCVCVCVCERESGTVNKIKVIQTDFSLQTLNWGLPCSPSSPVLQLPVSTFWISERARWLQNTVPSLSLHSSRLSSTHTAVLFKLPTYTSPSPFFISSHSSIYTRTPLFLSWRRGRGYTPRDCPGLCCQAFPKLNFPSLTAVCLLRRLHEKWKEPVQTNSSLPCSSFASSSSSSSWSSIQTVTDALAFLKE